VDYQWDENKRQANIRKHGLDFADAVDFEWQHATHDVDSRRDYCELRIVSFAPLHGRICALLWTQRDDHIRIFGLRKANKREIKRYENKT